MRDEEREEWVRKLEFVAEDEALTSLATPLILGVPPTTPTGSIRQRRVHRPEYVAPRSVYLVYMKFDEQAGFIVKHVAEHGFEDSVTASEGRLLRIAKGQLPHQQNTRDFGANFVDVVWKRPYYLTFVIDNAGWKIHWGPDGRSDPLIFRRSKPGSNDIYLTDNYTFFDAEPVPHLGQGDAFRCINYHLADDGHAVQENSPKKYCFQIYLETPFALNRQTHVVIIIDPDGQNQGPRT